MGNPIEIKVNTIDDAEPSFPEMVLGKNAIEGQITGVSILENGTVNGLAALGFRIKLQDGSYVLAQLTQTEFEFIAAVLRGSIARFADLKNRRHES
jgi:hypothetical protein